MRITFDNLERKDSSYNFFFIIVSSCRRSRRRHRVFFPYLFSRCSSRRIMLEERDSEKFFSSARDSSTAI